MSGGWADRSIRRPDRNIHALILNSACTLLVIICFEKRMIISIICVCVCVCVCACLGRVAQSV